MSIRDIFHATRVPPALVGDRLICCNVRAVCGTSFARDSVIRHIKALRHLQSASRRVHGPHSSIVVLCGFTGMGRH
jgi:hypothetical protein